MNYLSPNRTSEATRRQSELESFNFFIFSASQVVRMFACDCLSAITDGPKDTSPEDTLAKTYVPSLKTLEEEVMETLGIQENRRHRRSYWY